MKQILSTGIIRSPHGVKGFVKVQPYAEDFSHFFKLKEVTVDKNGFSKSLEIENVQPYGNELLVKFKGVDTPEDAKLISGWQILIPRNQASRLEKGNVYVADLIGMHLIYEQEVVGTVVSTAEGAQSLLLEVKCLDDKLRMIPYMKGIYIDDVSLENNSMKLLKKELCFEY